MEYSRALSSTAQILVDHKLGRFEVYQIFSDTWKLRTIVSNLIIGRKAFKGTASGTNIPETLVKSCVEAGEVFVAQANALSSRTGLAGGFIANAAINRAKYELVERDAFFHHYRTLEPFKKLSIKKVSQAILYELNSRDPGTRVVIAFPRENSECIKFGLGASSNLEIAVSKAYSELRAIELDHTIRHGYCGQVFKGQLKPDNLPDFHHAQSRDRRNHDVFKILRDKQSPWIQRNPILNSRIIRYASPLRFVKYVRMEIEDLHLFDFGSPEPDSVDLYHPLW